ncbi:MAG: hypothetical protein NTX13_03335 [Acidobacteria bacterium]|nr:hypothetical protein [Acidobacteriota bacterium]
MAFVALTVCGFAFVITPLAWRFAIRREVVDTCDHGQIRGAEAAPFSDSVAGRQCDFRWLQHFVSRLDSFAVERWEACRERARAGSVTASGCFADQVSATTLARRGGAADVVGMTLDGIGGYDLPSWAELPVTLV